MVLRRCRALLRSDAQAEDAMHDVFVAVLRAGGRLEEDAPAALLLRVATNVCLNRLRTRRRLLSLRRTVGMVLRLLRHCRAANRSA